MAKPNRVSLTTFVDFVSKSGTPKITVVRRFKRGDAYRPAFDFYKPVRDAMWTSTSMATRGRRSTRSSRA